jgi:hypothetical protein
MYMCMHIYACVYVCIYVYIWGSLSTPPWSEAEYIINKVSYVHPFICIVYVIYICLCICIYRGSLSTPPWSESEFIINKVCIYVCVFMVLY